MVRPPVEGEKRGNRRELMPWEEDYRVSGLSRYPWPWHINWAVEGLGPVFWTSFIPHISTQRRRKKATNKKTQMIREHNLMEGKGYESNGNRAMLWRLGEEADRVGWWAVSQSQESLPSRTRDGFDVVPGAPMHLCEQRWLELKQGEKSRRNGSREWRCW